MILWDCAIERILLITTTMAKNNENMEGWVPHNRMSVQPYDISHLCEYKLYE